MYIYGYTVRYHGTVHYLVYKLIIMPGQIMYDNSLIGF